MKRIIIIIIVCLNFSIQLCAQQSKTTSNRPIGVSKGIIKNNQKSAVLISEVPAYLWHRGCGPTSLGMLIGYYDSHGFPDLIDGDASTQTNSVNDAIANDEHYNDYSLPLDYYPNLEYDKSDLDGAHNANCMADFMKTSWSSESNFWGWSWNNMVGAAFVNYIFMKNNVYQTYETYENFSNNSSWAAYINEIESKSPVVILVDSDGDGSTDHFVTGIGYDQSDTTYAIYDTWDSNIHWYKWRGISTGNSWGIFGFNILKILFNISASVNIFEGGIVNGMGGFEYNQTASLTATELPGYDFKNWTENGVEVSTNANYSFNVIENRTLVANFELESKIDDYINKSLINIYPNPVSEIIMIEVEDNNIAYNFEIINSLGKVVFRGNFVKNTTVHINGFASGVYVVKFENGKTVGFKKMVKE